jgi:hypothetical protein
MITYAPAIIRTALPSRQASTRLIIFDVRKSAAYDEFRQLARQTPLQRRQLLGMEMEPDVPLITKLTNDVSMMQQKLLSNRQAKDQVACRPKIHLVEGFDEDDDDGSNEGEAGKFKWLYRDGDTGNNGSERMVNGRRERQWGGMRWNGVVYWVSPVLTIRRNVD